MEYPANRCTLEDDASWTIIYFCGGLANTILWCTAICVFADKYTGGTTPRYDGISSDTSSNGSIAMGMQTSTGDCRAGLLDSNSDRARDTGAV